MLCLNSNKSTFNRTSLDMWYNRLCLLETLTAWATTILSVIWVYQLMVSQFTWCMETFLTFTANIRLHTFMSTYVRLKTTTVAVFLLTNVTCKQSAFIVWLQQMMPQLVKPCKSFWTVSTWVYLCTSVSTNTKLQLTVCNKWPFIVRTWYYVAVHTMFMCLQVVWSPETFVTQRTLVWAVRVNFHVFV